MSGILAAPPRRYVELGLAVVVVAIVAMMIVPLPTWLLDLLIGSNLALAIVLLSTSLFVRDALGFGAFPTILLISTLYRLALNVSSTRLILLQADAGEVIGAFGDFVVRGDYVVGAVVFLILTLVQFIVIARGAERVAEVGARFTLDAMPGKQLAIDADLRSGLLDAEGAAARRRGLERESQLYGAMDGAMKFVKGDAIAGLVITGVNLIGGLAIGVGMRSLPFDEALRTYGLLTIGDGLVSQIPALVIATAAGLVVTRVASEKEGGTLGADLVTALSRDPRAIGLTAAFMAALGLVPGLPALPFLALAIGLGVVAFFAHRAGLAEAESFTPRSGPIALRVGPVLAERLASERAFRPALEGALAGLHARLGFRPWSPTPRVDDGLEGDGYALEVAALEVDAGRWAEHTSGLAGPIARALEAHADALLGLDEVSRELDALREGAPALVAAVSPTRIELARLTALLRGLLREGVSIAPLREILESLATGPALPADDDALLARAREALGARRLLGRACETPLVVHPIDPMVEEAIRDARTPHGALALPPDLGDSLVDAIRERAAGADITLVTQRDVRLALHRLLRAEGVSARVFSYPELADLTEVERTTRIAP